jgi:hypothetical protein
VKSAKAAEFDYATEFRRLRAAAGLEPEVSEEIRAAVADLLAGAEVVTAPKRRSRRKGGSDQLRPHHHSTNRDGERT